ncbi:MAG: hypothetical protein M9962_13315 [Oligoflexia bacterium]|nr:hypothetical protein [Oligoflexia bacterium]
MITGIIIKNTDGSNTFQIGDLVTLTIGSDIGYIENEKWIVDGYEQKWIPSQSILVDNSSIRSVHENGLHKIYIQGVLHKSGPINFGPLNIRRIEDNKIEYIEVETNLGEAKNISISEGEKIQPYTSLIPRGGIDYYTLSALLLALLIFAVFLIRFFKKKETNKVEVLNPKQSALKSLQELQKYSRVDTPLASNSWKDFSYSLVKIIKVFVRQNFNLSIEDLTDKEFIEKLGAEINNENQISKLENILTRLNGVRFGQEPLNKSEIPQLIIETRSFIESTFIDKDKRKK